MLRGEEALKEGRPDSALIEFERALSDNPQDTNAQHGRQRALRALLNEHLTAAASARAGSHFDEALAELSLAHDVMQSGAFADPELNEIETKTLAVIRSHLRSQLRDGLPLGAFNQLQSLAPMLSSLGHDDFIAVVRTDIVTVGARRCQVLSGLARTPWLTRFMHRWCTQFAATPPAVPDMPEQRARLTIDLTALASSTDAQERLRNGLEAAFATSPWFGPSPSSLDTQLSGALESSRVDQPIDTFVTWTESETYSTTENVTETYQEPYQTTESRPTQVPYTAYESYTYTCGRSTCTGSRSVTRYRTEYRNEPVTKYRAATRQVTKTVYKTRPVTRRHDFHATHVIVKHAAKLRLAMALPGTSAPVVLELSNAADADDLAHRETNPRAGLKPHEADVPSSKDFDWRVSHQLSKDMAKALDDAWVATFCTSFETPEAAARCVASDAAPLEAWSALVRFTGESASALRGLPR